MPLVAVNTSFLLFPSKYKSLTLVRATDLKEAAECSRALWPSQVGEGVGGGKRAKGLRVCLGGFRCPPGVASTFLQRFLPPQRARPVLGQLCPGARHSSLHTEAPLGLYHAGAGGGHERLYMKSGLHTHTQMHVVTRLGKERNLYWRECAARLSGRTDAGWLKAN